jgi:hypothetical protein
MPQPLLSFLAQLFDEKVNSGIRPPISKHLLELVYMIQDYNIIEYSFLLKYLYPVILHRQIENTGLPQILNENGWVMKRMIAVGVEEVLIWVAPWDGNDVEVHLPYAGVPRDNEPTAPIDCD